MKYNAWAITQRVRFGRLFAAYFWICNCAITSLPLQASEATTLSTSTKPLTAIIPLVVDNERRDFDTYFMRQLTLALVKSGKPFQIIPYETSLFVESRSEYNLLNERYNVHWLNTNVHRESNLIPIRIPLFKGLIGWRIFFIPKGRQQQFSQLTNLSALKRLSAGQGHDWPDTRILQANHFALERSSNWRGLFHMLEKNRIDYFPRSVIEIWREQRIFNALDIELEQDLAIRYPAAYYFFVSPSQKELAQAIEDGLKTAINDGSFDLLFNEYFGPTLHRSRLGERKVFSVNNPFMDFPDDPRLWYTPKTNHLH